MDEGRRYGGGNLRREVDGKEEFGGWEEEGGGGDDMGRKKPEMRREGDGEEEGGDGEEEAEAGNGHLHDRVAQGGDLAILPNQDILDTARVGGVHQGLQ